MRSERSTSPWPRLVWGVTLVAAGIIFWLDRTGSIEAREYLQWWPVAVIAGGLAHLPQRKWAPAIIWIVIGLFFLLPMLGFPQIRFWRLMGLWPLMFSIAGATLMAQSWRRREKVQQGRTFTASAMMGANIQSVATSGLAGGEAVAVMAGCEIELLPSSSAPSEIVIEVLAVWGGVEIHLPAGWRTVNDVTTILGGIEDKTVAPAEGAPTVLIRGTCIMGGVEITTVAGDRA
ncbi:MAG TPA: DUF5668 domain-containing protein [Thermoanaerobaculia bacterium]|nr:DUF5668 domain-containing protein [Thermoanaerobaculia bacterium]